MYRLLEVLREARDHGRVVTIAYDGGSRPGSPRQLVPLRFHGMEMEARDVAADLEKHYRLDKILWVEARGVRTEAARPTGHLSLPVRSTLADYARDLRTEFQAAGWFVHESSRRFGVGTCFKNGKPKKTPSVAISYYGPHADGPPGHGPGGAGGAGGSGPSRPWRVDSWRYASGRTYGSLQRAMWEFYTEVCSSDPKDAKGMFAGHL